MLRMLIARGTWKNNLRLPYLEILKRGGKYGVLGMEIYLYITNLSASTTSSVLENLGEQLY